jgi:2-(1,2-epoxy-1,2-dihydrophenyl)acetyl-CoA isomerase
MANSSVLIERIGGSAVITLNRPAVKNAIDSATADAIAVALRTLRADEEVLAVS